MEAFFNISTGILSASWRLLTEMAPFLLLGFLVAGILNEFVSAERIARHLGRNNFASIVKAALFGIPLPLCSCGVIPPTVALRKGGAGRGAVLSFLIATPTSGVDSIAATYSLMGPFFALYRVTASFLAAIFTGSLAGLLRRSPEETPAASPQADNSSAPIGRRVLRVFRFGYFTLLSEIGKWLILGLLIGGLVTFLLPDDFFGGIVPSGFAAILLMIVVAVPLYVCATGSIPIAASLMMKGLNPGAAFVFLLAGPATNSVTITVISKFLGKKTTLVYVAGIVISSIGLGLLLDLLWSRLGMQALFSHHHQHGLLPETLMTASAVLLTLLLIAALTVGRLKTTKRTNLSQVRNEMTTAFLVPDMTCNNCVAHVKKAVEGVDGVEQVVVDLRTKRVEVQHADRATLEKLMSAVRDAGYEAVSLQ